MIIVASLTGFFQQYNVNADLQESLNKEKLNAESLLSQKLLLDKDIAKFKEQIESLKGINADIDRSLANVTKNLQKAEDDIRYIKRENATVRQVKKQNDELIAVRKALEKSILELNSTLVQLQNEKVDLANKVAFLEQQNGQLVDDLQKAQIALFDQSQVESVKKNERLTVNARKTKKLNATFNVPSNMRDIGFRIYDPDGKIISTQDKGSLSFQTSDNNVLTASSKNDAQADRNPNKKVTMSFASKDKLKPGVYKIEILSEKLYVASMQVKLK